MTSSPLDHTVRSGDDQVGDQVAGDWPDPVSGDGPGVADPDMMNDDVTNMQSTDQQDADQEPFDQTPADDGDLDPDADAPQELSMEGYDNTGAGTVEGERQGNALTETEVRGWDHRQAADHLRQIGVDSRHCEVLEEHEITGDVLLGMNQESIFSQNFDFGVMGKRLKTSQKIRQFQQEVQDGTSLAQPAPTINKAVEEPQAADEDPLQRPTFKHPFKWRQDMAGKLQLQETSDVQPAELLDDLELKPVDQHPTFMETLAALDGSQDDVGDIISTHKQAKNRLRLGKDEAGGVERATSSMCSDWLDKFNEGRKLAKYRSRWVVLLCTAGRDMLTLVLSPALPTTTSSGCALGCSNSNYARQNVSTHFHQKPNTQIASPLSRSCRCTKTFTSHQERSALNVLRNTGLCGSSPRDPWSRQPSYWQ
jgi:SAM domain (Sterile alpha motif)